MLNFHFMLLILSAVVIAELTAFLIIYHSPTLRQRLRDLLN